MAAVSVLEEFSGASPLDREMGVAGVKCEMPPSPEAFLFAIDRAEVVVASEGFEPPNAEQSDLQSDPFGRLGNSPERTRPT